MKFLKSTRLMTKQFLFKRKQKYQMAQTINLNKIMMMKMMMQIFFKKMITQMKQSDKDIFRYIYIHTQIHKKQIEFSITKQQSFKTKINITQTYIKYNLYNYYFQVVYLYSILSLFQYYKQYFIIILLCKINKQMTKIHLQKLLQLFSNQIYFQCILYNKLIQAYFDFNFLTIQIQKYCITYQIGHQIFWAYGYNGHFQFIKIKNQVKSLITIKTNKICQMQINVSEQINQTDYFIFILINVIEQQGNFMN
ncbi:transmembrane protein, putative (macronuclear) [Tetrahymena thermophila SB210]|uniref:Transmembrane protein, putative n=1 Tax=Tetrahymena thermophila (strain SB210) TaxID=312017 RepID=W7X904_TETTS|nr:transmembrane protein, putative [Tetrahymena thermophila SB210]EWS72863.1 transmembrane protein, putative [Tetrahymena thermophila SB210]|eukprot:XP_012654591.1 transmembrane protein, putative [Tetrahymena thermophila SB210]